jgi:archaellum component FlaC
MEEGDPFYLNELIVDKDQDKVFEEVNSTLDECFENITNAIQDKNVCIEGLYDYLNDVENVLEQIEGDLEKNDKALESIEEQIEALNTEVDALIAKVEVLDSAKTIIEGMYEFYTDLEDAIYEEINRREGFIVEDEECHCCGQCDCECDCECKCGKECQCHNCETHIEETQPQRELNINDIINMVFGDGRKLI